MRLRPSIALVVTAGAFLTSAFAVGAQPWRQPVDPARAGWNMDRLAAARRLADSLGSTAVVVVHRGVVVAAWGEIATPLAVASVRKSLMATLVGAEWRHGGLRLRDRLSELGISDLQPLDSLEGRATVRDVLAARSGVYRPAAQEPAAWAKQRPAPGAHAPGVQWFYNNWSFNVVGSIYEGWRRRSVYAGFLEAVARPIGMEDYSIESAALRFREPSRSIHAAHSFRMSARDLARVGELYVRSGRWGRVQVLAPGWVDSVRALSTRATDTAEGWSSPVEGYGYGWLWWINPGRGRDWGVQPHLATLEHMAAIGAGAQLLIVAPETELVIAHLAHRGVGPDVEERVAFEVAEAIVAAMPKGRGVRPGGTTVVSATPFTHRTPVPPRPLVVATSASDVEGLLGDYDAGQGVVMRVFVHDGGLFVAHPRLGDLELMRARDVAGLYYDVGGRLTATFSSDGAGTTLLTVQTPSGRIVARKLARPGPVDAHR